MVLPLLSLSTLFSVSFAISTKGRHHTLITHLQCKNHFAWLLPAERLRLSTYEPWKPSNDTIYYRNPSPKSSLHLYISDSGVRFAGPLARTGGMAVLPGSEAAGVERLQEGVGNIYRFTHGDIFYRSPPYHPLELHLNFQNINQTVADTVIVVAPYHTSKGNDSDRLLYNILQDLFPDFHMNSSVTMNSNIDFSVLFSSSEFYRYSERLMESSCPLPVSYIMRKDSLPLPERLVLEVEQALRNINASIGDLPDVTAIDLHTLSSIKNITNFDSQLSESKNLSGKIVFENIDICVNESGLYERRVSDSQAAIGAKEKLATDLVDYKGYASAAQKAVQLHSEAERAYGNATGAIDRLNKKLMLSGALEAREAAEARHESALRALEKSCAVIAALYCGTEGNMKNPLCTTNHGVSGEGLPSFSSPVDTLNPFSQHQKVEEGMRRS